MLGKPKGGVLLQDSLLLQIKVKFLEDSPCFVALRSKSASPSTQQIFHVSASICLCCFSILEYSDTTS